MSGARPARAAGNLATGLGFLVQGVRFVLARPRLFWLGAIPPLVTSVIMVVATVVLVIFDARLVAAITPFADDWPVRDVLRVILGIVVVLAAIALMVLLFTGLTLAIGAPLYDKITRAADDACGGVNDEHSEPTMRSMVRMIGHTALGLLISAGVAIVLFAVGFVPLVGQIVGAVGAAVVGGWMISSELVAGPLERRGVTSFAARWRRLRRCRGAVLGFGVPAFWLLSIPFVAVLVFPGAAAGGALLARRLEGEPTAVQAA